MFRRTKATVATFTVAVCLVFAATATADQLCKDTKITVTNKYKNGNNKVKIKILSVNYYDKEDGKWRTNDVKNTDISADKAATITESLEYVGNEKVTKMQVKFKFEENKGWSTEKWSNVTSLADKTCDKGEKYNLTVSGTDSKK